MAIEITSAIVDNKQVQILPIIEYQMNVEIILLSKFQVLPPKTRVNEQEITKQTIAIFNASLSITFTLSIILKTCIDTFMIILSFQL
jgi:hypothetical protein